MKEYNIFENHNLTPPRYVQCTIPSLLYQTRRKIPLVLKRAKVVTGELRVNLQHAVMIRTCSDSIVHEPFDIVVCQP